MTVYEAVVDSSDANISHTLIVEEVGSDKTVLDVGCATGYLAEALGRNGCTVSGIEYSTEAAEAARAHLDQLVVADLNAVTLADAFSGRSFDTVVFGDVLEHLLDPAAALRSAASLLAPGGKVVVSIPNVAHGSVRLALLAGRWNYADRGLLDATHIRFFTYETLQDLLWDSGYVLESARSTVVDALATEIHIPSGVLSPEVVDWVRSRPYADAYQFVVTARLRTPEDTRPDVQVRPAATLPAVDDEYTQKAAVIRADRHSLLTMKDHIIGLEAENAASRARVPALERKIRKLNAELGKVAEDRATIYRSSTWRIGRAALAPVRIIRRGR
ncbi:class I SAM-dependent methyltransferase [Sanguibacter sp. 4.1]|uniref:Class I SAM-dependent methyltransferase n=1 Tax=Sanguibacter biliveldensis TaxID=3030830 RepID=A0AAF0Z5T0_9MICO|nr:class I SAM-dependent methyltransferase [Sanguibacter sp. 4.1]WPF83205.1 class I SAM-dependent methyltransferase [Sanguibacter sp. 4.1]